MVRVYKMTSSFEVNPTPIGNIKGRSRQSLFGSSLLALGKLDNDNYEDFAVGAPGEDEGKGAVYIYYGDATMSLGINLYGQWPDHVTVFETKHE